MTQVAASPLRSLPTRYTLWSRDRLLGESTLDYVRCMPRHRMGDLIPTAIGHRLLSSEAHLDALALEIRGPDGRIIPSEWIDVRDAGLVASLSPGPDALDESGGPEPEPLSPMEADIAMIKDWIASREPDGFWDDYPDDDAWIDSAPRYQIQVRLAVDSPPPA